MGALVARGLVQTHRWLGVAVCLLFAMWFASGIVMLYVPFPRLTDAKRPVGLFPLAADTVGVDLGEVTTAAGMREMPREARLGMLLEVFRRSGSCSTTPSGPGTTSIRRTGGCSTVWTSPGALTDGGSTRCTVLISRGSTGSAPCGTFWSSC